MLPEDSHLYGSQFNPTPPKSCRWLLIINQACNCSWAWWLCRHLEMKEIISDGVQLLSYSCISTPRPIHVHRLHRIVIAAQRLPLPTPWLDSRHRLFTISIIATAYSWKKIKGTLQGTRMTANRILPSICCDICTVHVCTCYRGNHPVHFTFKGGPNQ